MGNSRGRRQAARSMGKILSSGRVMANSHVQRPTMRSRQFSVEAVNSQRKPAAQADSGDAVNFQGKLAAISMGKPSVKGLSSSNRWATIAMLDEDEGNWQHDLLSNLPDDILLNIIERLDIADTIRTSILSRRWKPIPTMLSKILIMVGSTDIRQERSCDDVARANATMLGATRSLLEGRSTSPYTIHQLRMQFYLGDGSIKIGQTVANIIATQKIGVAEFTILTEKEGKRCRHDGVDVVAHGKQLASFVNACAETFSCLTRLALENLRLVESDFPKLLKLCKWLEFLRLDNCDMGYLSFLAVEHP